MLNSTLLPARLGSHGPFLELCLFLLSFIALTRCSFHAILFPSHHYYCSSNNNLSPLSSFGGSISRHKIFSQMGCKDMAKKVKWERIRSRRRRRYEGVEKRMKKLQRLVPGGAGMNPDRLFLKTAEHILQLRLQLNVLQALSKVFKA
ncbi:hypothetical protein VNO78_27255 [Psophocarpus tetragonolobus]|uniref:Uncharacterized protein n=1 Tax=Psophocarpus tetragonolobus TaxID=3891 RepID=A0AAN9XB21_PSOTE